MHLRELVLHNVGVFLGRHRINLATEPGRPVILVGGMNGRGKTTLLDALQLALYGRRSPAVRKALGNYDDYLASLIHHHALPSEAAVSLEFSLVEDGADVVYRVERVWVAKGSGAKETLTVRVNGIPDAVAGERWADIAESLLPVEIAELFLFDGEKIEQLADPATASKVIEAAVHGLLGVGLVERLQRDITALQRRWRVDEADQGVQERVTVLETRLSELGSGREILVQDRAAMQNAVDDSTRKLAEARDDFTRNGGDLAAQREEIEQDLASLSGSADRLRSQLVELAGGPLPLALVRGPVERAQRRADFEQAATATALTLEVLDERDQTVLRMLEARGVDGSDLDIVSRELERDRQQRAEASAAILHFGLGLHGPTSFSNATAGLRTDGAAAGHLIEELALIESKASVADRRLHSVPPDAVVARLTARVVEAEATATRHSARMALVDEQLEDLRRTQNDVEAQLERLLERYASQINATEDRARMQRHADKAQLTLTTFRERMVTRQLSVIEVSVLRSFQQLLGKKGLVDQLAISPIDFSVTLHGSSGEQLAPERLSAGERQLLATALLWGLARASGRRLPMAIDTPLGRLDSDHRRNLVERYFPVASSQILLLSTDEEIDEKLLGALLPHISRSYILSYDDTRRATSIDEGYFWETQHVA